MRRELEQDFQRNLRGIEPGVQQALNHMNFAGGTTIQSPGSSRYPRFHQSPSSIQFSPIALPFPPSPAFQSTPININTPILTTHIHTSFPSPQPTVPPPFTPQLPSPLPDLPPPTIFSTQPQFLYHQHTYPENPYYTPHHHFTSPKQISVGPLVSESSEPWKLFEERDQMRKIVEQKLELSFYPMDWCVNFERFRETLLERYPELADDLSSPPFEKGMEATVLQTPSLPPNELELPALIKPGTNKEKKRHCRDTEVLQEEEDKFEHAEIEVDYVATTVGTSLVDMYAKCGEVGDAHKVVDNMPERNSFTSSAIIAAYMQKGDVNTAKFLFENMSMRTKGSWVERIDGYANNVEMGTARKVFKEMPWRNFFVWSSMIAGYCQKGDVEEARAIFDWILVQKSVSWNLLISEYAQNGFSEEALEAFRKTQAEGFQPIEIKVVGALSVCAQLGLLDVGKEIHHMIQQKGIKLNQFVPNALVDMYAKCGELSNARSTFDKMPRRNTIVSSPHTLLLCSSQILCEPPPISLLILTKLLQIFHGYKLFDVMPDPITFQPYTLVQVFSSHNPHLYSFPMISPPLRPPLQPPDLSQGHENSLTRLPQISLHLLSSVKSLSQVSYSTCKLKTNFPLFRSRNHIDFLPQTEFEFKWLRKIQFVLYYNGSDKLSELKEDMRPWGTFFKMESSKLAADEVFYGLLFRIYGKLGLLEGAHGTSNGNGKFGVLIDGNTNICLVIKIYVGVAGITTQALSTINSPYSVSYKDTLNLYRRRGLFEMVKDVTLKLSMNLSWFTITSTVENLVANDKFGFKVATFEQKYVWVMLVQSYKSEGVQGQASQAMAVSNIFVEESDGVLEALTHLTHAPSWSWWIVMKASLFKGFQGYGAIRGVILFCVLESKLEDKLDFKRVGMMRPE